MTVSSVITDLKNATEYNKAQKEPSYSSKVSSSDFLYLLTQQLQYQDPMNPMDNSEMLAQEAQFSTLEQMEALTSSFTQFSNVYQANSLMGQTIEVKDGDKTVKGKVDYVDMSDAKGASISVNGKLYPLSSVSKVYPEDTKAIDDQNAEDRNFVLSTLYYLGDKIGTISDALTAYLGIGNNTGDNMSSGNENLTPDESTQP